MGHTGSGKSTFIDLFLGLRFPTSGQIKIDDKNLNFSNTNDWQKNVSQVSQSYNLLNKSIMENIIFGSVHTKNETSKNNRFNKKIRINKKSRQSREWFK